MRYYARSKNYHSAQATGAEFRQGATGNGAGAGTDKPAGPPPTRDSGGFPAQAPTGASSNPGPAPGGSGGVRRSMPPPPPGGPPGRAASPVAAPSSSGGFPGAASPASQPPVGAAPVGGMTPARRPAPPAPAPRPTETPAAGAAPTLFLIFNNQRIPIDKDQFIIGRGSKTSDLPIKDGNISRKHAAVIRRNGTYYIKDLGSTNGIDYKGMRIDNKRIDEGDVFHLCDYELRFTYRA
jgi:hypothetical protein